MFVVSSMLLVSTFYRTRCQACGQADSPQYASSDSGARTFRTNNQSTEFPEFVILAPTEPGQVERQFLNGREYCGKAVAFSIHWGPIYQIDIACECFAQDSAFVYIGCHARVRVRCRKVR